MCKYLKMMLGLGAMSAAATAFMLAEVVERVAQAIADGADVVDYILDGKYDDWRVQR